MLLSLNGSLLNTAPKAHAQAKESSQKNLPGKAASQQMDGQGPGPHAPLPSCLHPMLLIGEGWVGLVEA